MPSFATLCLGTRQDALTWQKGCLNLGFTKKVSIRSPRPSLAEIVAFFGCDAEWLYIGGHFIPNYLFNESGDTRIGFNTTSVAIEAVDGKRTISHADALTVNRTAKLVLWGGCSVAGHPETVEVTRSLFGAHVLLGFAGSTGHKMVDAMLGGGFIKNDFFKRLKNNQGWTDTCGGAVQAWMDTAAQGYGRGDAESNFRAFDWNGNGYKLQKGAVVGK